MSTPAITTTQEQDALDSAGYTPDRVFYSLGSMLSVDDFSTDQSYHRGRLARALSYLHGTGTVSGLAVIYQGPIGPDEKIVVKPGIAIDRLGRIVELPADACIRLDRWYKAQDTSELDQGFHAAAGGVIVDVFIRFSGCERGKMPAFAAGPFDATDFTAPSRVRDCYHLDLVIRKEGTPALPQPAWPDLSVGPDVATRRAALHAAILASWHEGSSQWTDRGLVPLPEHAVGQDTTSVFLARFTIPASAGSPPPRTGHPIVPDNDSRSFLYTPGALARWLGL